MEQQRDTNEGEVCELRVGFLAEDLEVAMNAGLFTNLGRGLPVALGGDWNEKEFPDEAIFIIDEDYEAGTASDGELVYEEQLCTVRAWTNNRTERSSLKKDIVAILEAFPRSMMGSILPLDFLDKHGIQINLKRLE